MDTAVKMDLLRALVNDCLCAAAEEILRLVHKTLLQDRDSIKREEDHQYPLDSAHRDVKSDVGSTSGPQPVGEQTEDKVDLRMCLELPTENRHAVIRPQRKHINGATRCPPEPSVLTRVKEEPEDAHSDCGPQRCSAQNQRSPPEAQACESPQPLCLYRVQPAPVQRDSPVSAAPVRTRTSLNTGPSSGQHTLPKFIIQFKAGTAQKPFKCPCCPSAFSLTKTLIRHMKVHAEDQSYTCRVCEKRFCQRSHLVSHLRVHTGEKPYHCLHCPKTFSQKGSVSVHLRRYHPDQCFSCSQCSSSFSTQTELDLHLQKHSVGESK